VREALERVLRSEEFRASKRSQDFLRYVVKARLEGHADLLKERTIGIEVFGRSSDYDPTEDATVRVKAGEVRKRLVLYYSSHGAQDPVRIEVRPGSYAPEFRFSEEPHAVAEAPVIPPPEPVPVQRKANQTNLRLALAVGAIGLTVFALVALTVRGKSSSMDQFWGPVLSGSLPISLCLSGAWIATLHRAARPIPKNSSNCAINLSVAAIW
jgi:hypothetical protein